MKILAKIQQVILSNDIDSLRYANYLIEYPVADIAKFIDWKNILDKPPLNSSAKTISELDIVIKQSNNRSAKDEKLILNIDENPNFLLYKFVEDNNLKFPMAYFKELYRIVKPFIYNTKFYFNRARPYDLAKAIYKIDIPIIKTETHHTPSYPSGHVVYTNLATNVLGALYPQLKKSLTTIVDMTSQSRIKQGVHYPSDCLAGIELSNYLFNKLHPKLRKYYNDTLS